MRESNLLRGDAMNAGKQSSAFPKIMMAIATLAIAALVFTAIASKANAGGGGVALPAPSVDAPLASTPGKQTAVLAGGCFWGIQDVFQHVKGVKEATSGYSGGSVASPDYEEVSSGNTGHAESVKITFDPSQVSYGQLLQVFFSVAHDPTELDRQGPDTGTQYRSVIFYSSQEQQHIAQAYISQLQQAKLFSAPIVTEVVPLKAFYTAEDYHQNFATLHPDNPYIAINDAPKVEHLRLQFPALYKGR
jgi:peptide-methionine (S)-S-oxide reductase